MYFNSKFTQSMWTHCDSSHRAYPLFWIWRQIPWKIGSNTEITSQWELRKLIFDWGGFCVRIVYGNSMVSNLLAYLVYLFYLFFIFKLIESKSKCARTSSANAILVPPSLSPHPIWLYVVENFKTKQCLTQCN